jgi:hypothetical protein
MATTDGAADEEVAVPELTVPFPRHVHPHLEQAQTSTFAWAQQMGLLSSEAAVARFEKLRSGHLAAYVYTEVDLDELLLGADWKTWMFMIDDQGDEGPLGRKPGQWREAMKPFTEVLEGNASECDHLSPVARALADLLRRTCVDMPPAWPARLYGHIADFLNSYQDEAERRASHRIPTVSEYITHRRDSGAMHIVYDVAEALVHQEVPPTLYHSREFQDLEVAACDVISWQNDLRSLRKELARHDVHNLVLVLQSGLDCTLAEAAARAQDMTEARMAWYVQGRRQMEHILDASALSAARRHGVRQVLRIYEDWMSGHYQWGAETGRYTDIVYTSPGATPNYIEQLLTPRAV